VNGRGSRVPGPLRGIPEARHRDHRRQLRHPRREPRLRREAAAPLPSHPRQGPEARSRIRRGPVGRRRVRAAHCIPDRRGGAHRAGTSECESPRVPCRATFLSDRHGVILIVERLQERSGKVEVRSGTPRPRLVASLVGLDRRPATIDEQRNARGDRRTSGPKVLGNEASP
jgi:hypothetical protein